MIVLVLGVKQQKRDRLVEVLKKCQAARRKKVLSFASTERASTLLKGDAASVDVVIVSMERGHSIAAKLAEVRECFPFGRIVVDLPRDIPALGFEALLHGASCVDFGLYVNSDPHGKLNDFVTRVADNKQESIDIYTSNWRSQNADPSQWGFMSMTFDQSSQAYDDYRSALRPAANRAGVDLRRVDEIDRYRSNILDLVRSAIKERKVFVVDLAHITQSTMYEFGFADALERSILCIKRIRAGAVHSRNDDDIPALIRSFVRLEYSTTTELALRFFFTVGGVPNG